MSEAQGFSEPDRAVLLAVKGVGPTVVARLEQLGFRSLDQLAQADAVALTQQASAMLGSTCWRNSPQAREAMAGAVEAARRHCVS
ncbi:helix-hairpin-helix domain-containing protein [Pseudoxanthomonas winnipegensis]|uniref:Helix-hairpin-helix domain-containing protein n=1 Tax=Pseudoxanthomonas winnipegensis TaxID=2480810 RepID=A0A4Q8LUS0_9GAMM|nr:helix-hairpin-helix domain-containing protein [Pseudoxanthomonas winnipegensis]TAA34898.1 helix-hairpin-helix domain-containing protein [Pseudoxanthomonas winnipegensis]